MIFMERSLDGVGLATTHSAAWSRLTERGTARLCLCRSPKPPRFSQGVIDEAVYRVRLEERWRYLVRLKARPDAEGYVPRVLSGRQSLTDAAL